MKTKNSLIPDSNKELDTNPFFEAYNSIIINITNPFDSHHDVEEKIINKIPSVILNKNQTKFFKNLYVAAKPYNRESHINITKVQNELPELLNYNHGYNEWQLIDFAMSNNFDQANLVSIIAPIGRGKTSLLNYTYLYLRNKIPNFKKRVFPIIYNCHEFKIFFNDKKNSRTTFDYLFNEVFSYRLLNLVTPYTNLKNNSFWDWYEGESKTKYSSQLRLYREAKGIVSSKKHIAEYEKNIIDLKISEQNHELFLYTALKYVKLKKGKEIVVAFDNLDLLDIDSIQQFIEFIERSC